MGGAGRGHGHFEQMRLRAAGMHGDGDADVRERDGHVREVRLGRGRVRGRLSSAVRRRHPAPMGTDQLWRWRIRPSLGYQYHIQVVCDPASPYCIVSLLQL